MTEHETRYAEKIRALLAKAESTTPEEAALLVTKAQELMTRYAISQAMIDQAAGTTTDVIEQREVILVGNFHERKMSITNVVARANNCRPVYRQHGKGEWSEPLEVDGKLYKAGITLTLTGFRSDLERVLLLDASLQLQCASALAAWRRENYRDWWTRSEDHRNRKQFITSFADEVGRRLRDAVREAEGEAVRDEATRAGTSEAEAISSVALVLRSRKDQVKDWNDKHYGGTLRTVSRNYQAGSYNAREGGRDAGSRADLGRPSISGRQGLTS